MEADGGTACIATLMPKPTTVTAADGRGGLGTAIERPDEGGEGGNEDTTRFGTGALGRELGLGTLATGGRDSGGGLNLLQVSQPASTWSKPEGRAEANGFRDLPWPLSAMLHLGPRAGEQSVAGVVAQWWLQGTVSRPTAD